MEQSYNKTVFACFVGFIVQAIVNNFAPLLFLTFNRSYGVSLDRIALLVTINFTTQLIVDALSSRFVDKIGYRAAMALAHIFAAAGLVMLGLLPEIMADKFLALVISGVVCAIGGGIIEVIASPIVENCPTKNKVGVMSLLHSFYCWGCVGVVALSSAFFAALGIGSWRYLAFLWAAVPLANMILFLFVPIVSPKPEDAIGAAKLSKKPLFWMFLLFMLCSGAMEQSMSQWASAFAEKGLGISKTVGDLLGPLVFSLLMGTSRMLFAKFGKKADLTRTMAKSAALCVIGYSLAAFSPDGAFALVGCGLVGFSVGIMWPGTYSEAASALSGTTAVFAFLAMAGDLGCGLGPYVVGKIAASEGDLRLGIGAAAVFPLVMTAGLLFYTKRKRGR